MKRAERVLLVLGNQLFPPAELPGPEGTLVFMAEDIGLCTDHRHHQQKLVLFLAAMRHYADELQKRGYRVDYHRLDRAAPPLLEKLKTTLEACNASELVHFEIVDRPFRRRFDAFAGELGVELRTLPSPMFLCSRERFRGYMDAMKRPFMAEFYSRERRRLGILVEADGQPEGGKWSFDADNRKRLPREIEPPALPQPRRSEHVGAVVELVRREFPDHPGDARDFAWPVTRRQALHWLNDFLQHRFADFGAYEDAISQRSDTIFHSLLSPALNLGLLTPGEVVDRALERAAADDVAMNSLEGFVRQVIGWREFMRGIDDMYGERQAAANFFGHQRELAATWWRADTGIPVLDDTIAGALRHGWNHHIQRLMVIANVMNLAGIHPHAAYRWFMEMYVDSSDWVMGPNVYGMGLFSDGGIFATKPYICGSNYLLKMSDYPRGDWCDELDGLYWGFVERHRAFFAANQRLSMMVRALDKLSAERRGRIGAAAGAFIERNTRPAG